MKKLKTNNNAKFQRMHDSGGGYRVHQMVHILKIDRSAKNVDEKIYRNAKISKNEMRDIIAMDEIAAK